MDIKELGGDVIDFVVKYWSILSGMIVFGIIWYILIKWTTQIILAEGKVSQRLANAFVCLFPSALKITVFGMDFLSLGSLAKISPLFYPYRSIKIKMTPHEYYKRKREEKEKREEAEKKEMEETKKAKEVRKEILDEVLGDEEWNHEEYIIQERTRELS